MVNLDSGNTTVVQYSSQKFSTESTDRCRRDEFCNDVP
jgi:hypothetical protein